MASRQRLRREQMSSTLRLVFCDKEGSFSSLSRDTWTARSVGTHVNSDTTSNGTKISVSARRCDVMKWAKCWEFLTWYMDRLTTGFSRDARNFDSPYVGDDRNETMGLSGTSGLWIFGSSYRRGTLPAELRK